LAAFQEGLSSISNYRPEGIQPQADSGKASSITSPPFIGFPSVASAQDKKYSYKQQPSAVPPTPFRPFLNHTKKQGITKNTKSVTIVVLALYPVIQ
jgi:hypothetical protein